MNTKKCNKCLIEKSIENFANKNTTKDGKQPICKNCQNIYTRQHYKANKNRYIDRNKSRLQEFSEIIDECKKQGSCIKCKQNHVATLDFHHRNKEHKTFNISSKNYIYSKEKLVEELNKCDILCSNCHRILHWEERQNALVSALSSKQV